MDNLKIRYSKTLDFMKKHVADFNTVFDLGTPNKFSQLLLDEGFKVTNTCGEDLDFQYDNLRNIEEHDIVTALEICEHLLNPLQVLRNLPGNKLVASVPLSLWFAKAYRSKTDEWDRHFHEFEDWQFDWLLEKAGWKVIDRVKWKAPVNKMGIRPILRRFTPRYYMVYAEMK